MQPIQLGSVGPEVEDVQRRLELLGHAQTEDDPGVFGPGTVGLVRSFQQSRGLTADGVVGEDTWRAIVEAGYQLGDRMLYVTRPTLRGDDIRELQRRLNRLGFDAGYVDGVFGPATLDALKDFQLNTGLIVDGIAGADTVAALRRLHRAHQVSAASSVHERESLREATRTTVVGARLLIDAGHGPDNPGYLGHDGTAEHEVTWQIASRIEGRLAALGASTILGRGPATTPTSSQRAKLANLNEVDAIVSVHLNGLASSSARGAAAYYFGTEGFVSEKGRRLAQLCVDAVCEATGTPNCRTHPSTSSLLRESRAPAVVVEPGFLTHPDEGAHLLEPTYQDQVAAAITAAIVTFLTGGAATTSVTSLAS